MITSLAGYALIGLGAAFTALCILLVLGLWRQRRAAAEMEWEPDPEPPVTADGTPEPMARIARQRRAEMGLPPLPGLQPGAPLVLDAAEVARLHGRFLDAVKEKRPPKVLEHTLPLGATADWVPQLHARAAAGFYHDAAPGAAQARAAAAQAEAAGIHPAAAAEAAFAALQGHPLEQSLAETRWGITGHAIRDRLTQGGGLA